MKKLVILGFIISVCACVCRTENKCELIVMESPNLKCDDSIRVYTPIGINADSGSIPTLFLLHGWSGNYKDWGDRCDVQGVSDRTGFRIICPDGFYSSWYFDQADSSKMQWRTFFDDELYPRMKERYDLDADATFITGLSMGGHGAINIFIDDTTRFRAAGTMSGVLDLSHTSGRGYISEMIGEDGITNESAVFRLNEIKGCSKPILVSCGYGDVYHKSAIEFGAKCREYEIASIELYSPGGHDWAYWDHILEQHLWYFNKIHRGENLGYKSN